MAITQKSGCPINLTLEVLGDRWSLIIVRDIIFGGRRHFRELLTASEEGIASNVLADRLRRLTEQGVLQRGADASHKQKALYALTEAGVQLLPILVQLGAWGRRHTAVTEELAIRAQVLEEGGPALWARFMDELRAEHLGTGVMPAPGASVREELQAAYLAVVARLSAAASG